MEVAGHRRCLGGHTARARPPHPTFVPPPETPVAPRTTMNTGAAAVPCRRRVAEERGPAGVSQVGGGGEPLPEGPTGTEEDAELPLPHTPRPLAPILPVHEWPDGDELGGRRRRHGRRRGRRRCGCRDVAAGAATARSRGDRGQRGRAAVAAAAAVPTPRPPPSRPGPPFQGGGVVAQCRAAPLGCAAYRSGGVSRGTTAARTCPFPRRPSPKHPHCTYPSPTLPVTYTPPRPSLTAPTSPLCVPPPPLFYTRPP